LILSLSFKAENIEKNIKRFYSITIEKNLFDEFEVITYYGRVGSRNGTRKTYYPQSLTDIKKQVLYLLKKRASAPKRIGCPYVLVDSFLSKEVTELYSMFVSDVSCLNYTIKN
jgi:predicted DNA-binding WGR domain protein